MPEPLKNIYGHRFLDELSAVLHEAMPAFDREAFRLAVLGSDWESLELKQRTRRITTVLADMLPAAYSEALAVLDAAAPRFTGLQGLIFPDFVEVRGLDDPGLSIPALARYTPFSTSEFAVRPFIMRYTDRMLREMAEWARHPSEHVRRLASEGCRPRLPWAPALPMFKADPSPILGILAQLKDDPSEYVRRSVANNLNDIAKDHPDVVLRIAKDWIGRSPRTDWIVKHACRTLLKRSEPEALALFGTGDASGIRIADFAAAPNPVSIGDAVRLTAALHNDTPAPRKLRIEYAIDYVKASGRSSRKVFKLAERDYPSGVSPLASNHSLRQMTTRIHYPGEHGVSLIVNGRELARTSFLLTE